MVRESPLLDVRQKADDMNYKEHLALCLPRECFLGTRPMMLLVEHKWLLIKEHRLDVMMLSSLATTVMAL